MPDLETAIVNSALWAAAGDALGWMAELTDRSGLRRRIGAERISHPVNWRRKIGGMAGATVSLPAGTYSDDTQLRLAVCRAIRGDGTFDAEAFAKIELPVWLSYSLGAGRGSKAAAANLVKRDVAWYSNFYSTANGRGYVVSGGNGAAMRVQPHVWQAGGAADRRYLPNVVKDAIITHGHMCGVLGAVFHADCVAYAIREGEIPSPIVWLDMIRDGFLAAEKAIEADPQLGRFWLSSWEAESRMQLGSAIRETAHDAYELGRRLATVFEGPRNFEYAQVLDLLDLRSDDRKGAGLHTALAAVAAAWIHRRNPVEVALIEVANSIGSDTDTIGTMAGAILGAITECAPEWPIQDRKYIIAQARRLAKMAEGYPVESFVYPDLFTWQPPATQSDAVGILEDGLAIAGLGWGKASGEQWKSGAFVWQWIRLSFGQTVLCKMKAELDSVMPSHNLPTLDAHKAVGPVEGGRNPGEKSQSGLPFDGPDHSRPKAPVSREKAGGAGAANFDERNIDTITDDAIRSNFDPYVLGVTLLECMDSPTGIERALGFASILAKAYSVRARRAFKR